MNNFKELYQNNIYISKIKSDNVLYENYKFEVNYKIDNINKEEELMDEIINQNLPALLELAK